MSESNGATAVAEKPAETQEQPTNAELIKATRSRKPKADSSSVTPTSETSSEKTSLEKVPAPEAKGEETHVEGEETPKAKPDTAKPQDELSLDQLNQKAENEGLSPDEFKARERLQQAERDRQAHLQQEAQEIQRQQDQRLNELKNLSTTLRTNVKTAVQSEIQAALTARREPDLNLIEQRVNTLLDQYEGQAEAKHTTPLNQVVDNVILHPEMYGDTPANRKALQAMSFGEKLAKALERQLDRGRALGPDEKSKVTPSSEWDADGFHKPSAKKALDDYKAANPGTTPPKTNGRSPQAISMDWIKSATTKDILALSREQRDQVNEVIRESRGR